MYSSQSAHFGSAHTALSKARGAADAKADGYRADESPNDESLNPLALSAPKTNEQPRESENKKGSGEKQDESPPHESQRHQ